ncbi:MAG TPA: Ig-like domain-containing protein, partial [Pirellulaceae bacterium]|nr:Ig-like domain-containing protein [Pirellulaceae bacterium]
MRIRLFYSLVVCLTLVGASAQAVAADDVIAPIHQRFAKANFEETPSFQKHVVPLFGRLGCNGRACHGSFQGQGGFRLSLFGYDFQLDHDALFDKDSPRVDLENPLESLIIAKPIDKDIHEGGMRYEKDSWQYNVIRRWIEAGAEFDKEQVQKLTELKIVPNELLLRETGETVQLKAIAIWADGSQEDVTQLCRFQSNDDQVATIDQNGLLTATNRGDTHLVISYDKAVVPVPVIRPVTDLVGDKYPQVAGRTKVDELVIEKLRKLGVVPSEVCTDAEFLRRVRLDLT